MLLRLYPESPLQFLTKDELEKYHESDIEEFKYILKKHFNKHDQSAMILQANVVYVLSITGKLYFSNKAKPPQLEAIVNNFDSDIGKKTCSLVRALVNGDYGKSKTVLTDKWPRYFWNRGIEIQPFELIMPESNLTEQETIKGIERMVTKYLVLIEAGLIERFNKIPKDIFKSESFEVLCGLLARQVSLSTRIARNSDNWDFHIGTLILRSMIDNHITLAWILKDIDSRIWKYILHGLGQEKLFLEHLENSQEDEKNDLFAKGLHAIRSWINEQRYTFLTEVNVGSWSGISTRQMAIEADCKDLYDFAYLPFSASTHNMWNHVGKYNLEQSKNPLHKFALFPTDIELNPQVDVLINSAKYLQKSFSVYDEYFKLECETKKPYDYLLEEIEKYANDELE